jgi:hypothetical protein
MLDLLSVVAYYSPCFETKYKSTFIWRGAFYGLE